MELPPTWHVGLVAYMLDNIIVKYARKKSTKSSSATIIHIIDKNSTIGAGHLSFN
jgi:hypothetical protein